MSAKIHNIENHSGNNKYNKLITATADVLKKSLPDTMAKIFDDTDDLLFNTAEKTADSNERNELFDMMRLLRIERNNIINNYISLLSHRISVKKQDNNDSFNADELSLVSQDEMEEMVAISSITGRSDNLHAEAISHLQARIEHLTLKTKTDFNKDALIPKHFCEDFVKASKHVNQSTNSKLIFLKVFSKHIDEALNKTYQAINQLFIENDILPQIKISAPVQASTPRPLPVNNDQYYSMAPVESPQPENNTSTGGQDFHQAIQSYMQSSLPSGAVTTINDQNFYDRSQVVNSLTNLQQKFSSSNQAINFDLIKRALLNNINSGSGGLITKQVNQIDEKTIDIIELLFSEILNDDKLTNAVRTLVLRLQIPTVKVAMLDQEFFKNANHPCRTFLNTLSNIGIGITDDEDELLSGIEIIIDTLINEYEQDSVSFQRALDSLNGLFYKDQNTCQKKETHTQRTILREHARKIVLQELQTYINGNTISKKNEALVLKLWPTQMYQQYINFGKDSEQWDDSVNTLQRIVNSLQVPDTQKKLQHLIANHDELLEEIQNKLYSTNQPVETINLAIYTLSESYLEIINQTQLPDSEVSDFAELALETFSGNIVSLESYLPAANHDDISLPDFVEPVVQVKTDKREQLQLLPNDVKPGLWFQLFDGEDKPPRRLKLSVIIMEEAQLIFVNRQGVKIMEKNAVEFAEELNAGTSKIIADHSLFDQALTNVISALSKSG